MRKNIYAVYDTLAQAVIGSLYLFPSDAAAVRFFGDVASTPDTQVARHIEDHNLLKLGTLDEEGGSISTDDNGLVITGAQWAAAQRQNEEATRG